MPRISKYDCILSLYMQVLKLQGSFRVDLVQWNRSFQKELGAQNTQREKHVRTRKEEEEKEEEKEEEAAVHWPRTASQDISHC